MALGVGGRAGRSVGGARADLLAVELRGAAGGPRRAGRTALGRAPRGRRGRRRAARWAAAFAVAFQDTLKIDLGSSGGLNKVTSGRADLIGGGVELFANRPLQGYGSGSFGRAYRLERKGNQQQAVSASHTMPVTVAAEQGLIGLAAYVAVLAAALWALFGDAAWRAARGARRRPRRRRRRLRRAVPGRARRAGGDVRGARWCTRWSTRRSSRTRSPG